MAKKERNNYKTLTRRAFLVGTAQLALVSGMLGRMYYLQVVEARKYKTLADENRISLRLIPPVRGEILDRNGVPMATNRQNYELIMVPEQARDVKSTLRLLGSLIHLPLDSQETILNTMRRSRSFMPIKVRDTLTWEEVAKVEVNAHRLSGVSVEPGQIRHYPFAEFTAHSVGYVGAVSEKDMDNDPYLRLPEARIGKNGLEATHEKDLRGKAGTRQVEVNAIGRVIRELRREEGQEGKTLVSSLDMELQKYTMERLGEESAAVVVMDVHTGEVLTLASNPSFDPNLFNFGLSHKQWQEWLNHPRNPLTNKAIAGQYIPGSTFKMIVAMAALEKGVLDPGEKVHCNGHVSLGNHRFHCWRSKSGHGAMNLKDALAQSCDVYFYTMAKRAGIDSIASMSNHFGLGATLGIDLPGEKPGLIPTRRWKMATFNEAWQVGETLVAGIGQGYVSTTPLQLATMMARLVNGGVKVEPTMVKHTEEQPPEFAKIPVKERHLQLVKIGTDTVVNEMRSTAFSSVYQKGRWVFGGKTGTAQVKRITMAERRAGTYDPEKRPWKYRDHALFVGYAPYDRPRYSVGVVVEHGISGSRSAAPIARDVLIRALYLAERNEGFELPETLQKERDLWL